MEQKVAFKAKKKGALGMEILPAVVIALGIAVFALALVLTLLGTFQDSQTTGLAGCLDTNQDWQNWNCPDEWNATVSGIEGLTEFNDWWPILVIASIFLIIFGLLAVIRSRTARI